MVLRYTVMDMEKTFTLGQMLVCIMIVLVVVGFIRVVTKRGSGQ